MTYPKRFWLPVLAICLWAGGVLPASEAPAKTKDEAKAAAHKQEAPKTEAKKDSPKPAPAAPPVAAKPSPAKPAAPRSASIRRPPVRKPAVTRRATAPVTVTASPEPPASTASPSTAVIHLVTHSADGASAGGLPVPDEISKLIEERARAGQARADWVRSERERLAMERALAERERAVSIREAAVRQPEPEPEPAAPARKRLDRNLLTNHGLVKLADAGYDEVFLMELIRRRPSQFDTTVEGLSYLMQEGLSQQLVRTVLAVDEWERARRAEELAGASMPAPLAGAPAQPPTVEIPAGMIEVRQKVMVPQGQLRAGERGVMMLAPSGERWYWVPDGAGSR